MILKDKRAEYGITVNQASEIAKVPVRTYIRYENDDNYGSQIKRKAILEALDECYRIDENKGLLKMSDIKNKVNEVLSKYNDRVKFCYLFGSYAKGYASETSDVDLCVSTILTGLDFVGLIEELRIALCKKVDLLRLSEVANNQLLLEEIMKDGVKIYG